MSDLRFLLNFSRTNYTYGDSNFFHVTAHVVYINDNGEVLNPNFNAYGSTEDRAVSDLDALVVTAQKNVEDEAGFYGYHVEFKDMYNVRLDRAEAMVKVLRKVTRKLDKMEQDFGYAADFPTFLARVANALGMVGYCFGQRFDAMRHDGTHYRWTDASGMRDLFSGKNYEEFAIVSRY